MTIVGVAADTKYWTIRNPISPTIYLPYRQLNINGRAMTIALRSRSDPAPLLPAVRRAMLDLDPNVPMFQVSTQRDQIERGVQQEWVLTRLLVFFGLLALALAAIGIYGTLSYSVSRRTAEIGLRMAMGAERADVIGLVLRESLVPVAVGVLVGLAGAFAGTRLVRGILFGIAPNDPLTIAGAVSVLVTSAVIAASVPADRASRVDPMTALRNE
jgi:ABC-type antimicrobial peptide transport system permease subunit